MELLDIFEFMTISYVQKTPELIILWLSKFPFYDRILFIKLFVLYRPIIIWRNYKKFDVNNKHCHESNCKCQDLYVTLMKECNYNFLEKVPNVWFLKKCIGSNNNENDYNLPEFHYTTRIKFMNYDNFKITYSQHSKINKCEIFNTDLQNYAIKSNHKFSNLTVSDIDAFKRRPIKIEKLIDKMNVKELYVMFSKFRIVRNLDVLMPEYLRIEALRNRSKNINWVNAESLLMNFYNFFNRKLICQTNTHMKMTMPLPIYKKIEEPIEDVNSEYFYQPKISGIRLFICKTSKSNVIIMNKNHVRINLNCCELAHLRFDKYNYYSGEFILVLYNIELDRLCSKKELVSYISTTYDTPQRTMYKLKLILVDLFWWNGVSLLIDTYERRYQLFESFTSFINHNDIIIKIKNYNNISTIYDEYQKYLQSSKLYSVVTGVLYKKKNAVYQGIVPLLSFTSQFQKYMIISKYEIDIKVLHKQNQNEIINKNGCILSPHLNTNNLTCICYEIDANSLKLALFDKNTVKPFCKVTTDTSNNKYKIFMNKRIKIENVTYKWIIVKVTFSENYEDIKDLQFCPEKTLFDCSSFWFCIAPNHI
ncbi:hypothetical protein CsNV_042 [Callinectes sapidus nudivirus]|nr:hypothetical protein CsNV_042 [Callinectes sapidus nudivirus]